MAIVCKSAAEIEKMRHSGRIVREVLDYVRTLVARESLPWTLSGPLRRK
jgi:methionine aminopeptidase